MSISKKAGLPEMVTEVKPDSAGAPDIRAQNQEREVEICTAS